MLEASVVHVHLSGEDVCLFQRDGHGRPVLGALAAGDPATVQLPA